MKDTLNKALLLLLVGFGVGALALTSEPWLLSTTAPVSRIPVKVTEIQQLEQGKWVVPLDAVAKMSTGAESYVLRLRHFRTESSPIIVVNAIDDHVLIRCDELRSGDLLVMKPAMIQPGQAVAPTEGVNDERLIHLTLEAGMAAVDGAIHK